MPHLTTVPNLAWMTHAQRSGLQVQEAEKALGDEALPQQGLSQQQRQERQDSLRQNSELTPQQQIPHALVE